MNNSSWRRRLHGLRYMIRRTILPILYPRRCPFCEELLPYSSYICRDCQLRLPMIHSPVCYQCGKPLGDSRQALCYDCHLFPKSFDRGFSLFLYNSMTQKAMIRFKYHNQRFLSDFFIHAICSLYAHQIKSWQVQAIIPIPVHKNKRKKRGYNQAQLLAEQLAWHLNLPCYSDFILRQIDTLPQKQFSPQARLYNLNKAFTLNPDYKDYFSQGLSRVLLIDDIYTTGATMESCSRLLKAAGAGKVYIASICIGVSRDEIL